jgi:hypothetical protein
VRRAHACCACCRRAASDARAPGPGAGSRGAHRSRLRGELLERLLDDGALELLAVMAQHTTRVRRRGRDARTRTRQSCQICALVVPDLLCYAMEGHD